MAGQFDDSDFVDTEFQAGRSAVYTPPAPAEPAAGVAQRAPSREELDTRVQQTQQRLEELRGLQERLEQERTALKSCACSVAPGLSISLPRGPALAAARRTRSRPQGRWSR